MIQILQLPQPPCIWCIPWFAIFLSKLISYSEFASIGVRSRFRFPFEVYRKREARATIDGPASLGEFEEFVGGLFVGLSCEERIDDASEGSAYDWCQPEEPELLDGPAADEKGGSGAAGGVD